MPLEPPTTKLKHGRNQTGEDGPCEPDCRKCAREAELAASEAAERDFTTRVQTTTAAELEPLIREASHQQGARHPHPSRRRSRGAMPALLEHFRARVDDWNRDDVREHRLCDLVHPDPQTEWPRRDWSGLMITLGSTWRPRRRSPIGGRLRYRFTAPVRTRTTMYRRPFVSSANKVGSLTSTCFT